MLRLLGLKTIFHKVLGPFGALGMMIRLMDKILHYLKDPKLWELWYIPYYGSCRILSINRRSDRYIRYTIIYSLPLSGPAPGPSVLKTLAPKFGSFRKQGTLI